MCWPYLSFDNSKIKAALQEASPKVVDEDQLSYFGRVMQKLKGPTPQEVPKETPWGLSKVHDELHTFGFWAGGSTNRKPRQYFLGQTKNSNNEEFETHEHIHASVRRRMLPSDDGQPSTWKPKALRGFELKWDEEKGQWLWVKKVRAKGDKYVVEIPEWMPNPTACGTHTEEFSLMKGPPVELLTDPAKCAEIQMVPHGWSKRLLLAFNSKKTSPPK